MKKFFKRSKSVIAFCMALVITLLTVVPSETKVYADATDRVSTFIDIAKSNNMSSLDSIENLTKDELRFLGVYLSNFYIPYGTELGLNIDSEKNEEVIKSMTEALKTNLNFSDDMSAILVEQILSLSRNNYNELVFRASVEYQKDYVIPVYSGGIECVKGNSIDFMEGMMGLYSTDKSPKSPYNYGYYGYEVDGTFIPVVDFCMGANNVPTPSMLAYKKCLSLLDINNGYGFSFFDFIKEEEFDSDTSMKDYLEEADADTVYELSLLNSKMAVDCFGNIIQLGPNHQYIVMPGCINPYTWVSVNSDGEDLYSAGSAFQAINFFSISEANEGALVGVLNSFPIKDDTNGIKQGCISTSKYQDKIKDAQEDIENDDGSKVNGELHLRVYRGSSNKLTDVEGKGWFKSGVYDEILKKIDSFNTLNVVDETTFAGVEDAGYFSYKNVHSRTAFTYSKILNNFVMIDNLGVWGFDGDTPTTIDYSTINIVGCLDNNGEAPLKLPLDYTKTDFKSKFNDLKAGTVNNLSTATTETILGIYITYAIAGLYNDDTESKKATIGKLGYRINISGLPIIENTEIEIPKEMQEDMIKQSIQNWIYYILHPTQGLDYIKVLMKNKTNAVLVGWHNDMLGTNSVGATTGTTLYRSNTGYVTTPDLSELQWTSSLINLYNNLIPYLIIFMLIIMLFAYIAGIMPFQRAVFGLVIFSVFLFSPVTLINNVVGASNRVSQQIYGEKFTYWAIVQEESYSNAIEEAASAETYDNYLRDLYAINSSEYVNQGGDSIVLKWQAPKKMASLMLTDKDTDTLNSLKSSRLLKPIFGGGVMSGETYLDGESDYLYRSYTDLANFSRYVYDGLSKTGKQNSYNDISVLDGTVLKNSIDNISNNYKTDRDLGYTNVNKTGNSDYSECLRLVKPMSSKIYLNAVNVGDSYKNYTINDFTGINQDVFNFSIPMFTQGTIGYEALDDNAKGNVDDLNKVFEGYSSPDKEKEISGLAAYGLMSESPFYYYSWCLYDMGMDTSHGALNGYKNLVLKPENGGFFYNTIGNGELKDFMDMKSMFTYIIPYLKYGNDAVRSWDENFGIYVYDGVPTEEGHWNDPDIMGNEELKRKYWHNLNVARLYMIYTPWVDLMYDCDYADAEEIEVMGKKFIVEDPINPASYPKERPMIFSESEMIDYGLSEADLTEVERRILECNRDMEESMYELLNYYNFKDVTLNTAAAMNCTFAFNNNFSENGILSNNINLYPQSFEISDFSFDAFLRFILANTIGESLNTSPEVDFYQLVVDRSSTMTAVMYLVVDFLSQYALPAFKIFFIMLVFISAVLLIIATAAKVDPEQKFINKLIKGIFKPMLGLLLINIGFSWVISLFMGVGNNAVTQSDVLSIQTGDPVIAMLIISALDIICMVLYFTLIKDVIKDVKHNFQLCKSFIQGAVGGAITIMGGTVAKAIKGNSISSNGGNVSSGGGNSVAEVGTGRQSPRATQRASQMSAEDKREMEESSIRRNEAKRNVFRQTSKKEVSSEKRTQNINEKIKQGNDRLNNKDTDSTSTSVNKES